MKKLWNVHSQGKPPGKLLKPILFLVGLFVAASSFSYLAELPSNAISVPHALRLAPLDVKRERLNFGKVTAQSRFLWTIPITNRSSDIVRIEDIKSSCHCTSIEPRSFSLAPGDTGEITLTLDLRAGSLNEAEMLTRPFTIELLPIVEGFEEGDMIWHVNGDIVNRLKSNPQSV